MVTLRDSPGSSVVVVAVPGGQDARSHVIHQRQFDGDRTPCRDSPSTRWPRPPRDRDQRRDARRERRRIELVRAADERHDRSRGKHRPARVERARDRGLDRRDGLLDRRPRSRARSTRAQPMFPRPARSWRHLQRDSSASALPISTLVAFLVGCVLSRIGPKSRSPAGGSHGSATRPAQRRLRDALPAKSRRDHPPRKATRRARMKACGWNVAAASWSRPATEPCSVGMPSGIAAVPRRPVGSAVAFARALQRYFVPAYWLRTRPRTARICACSRCCVLYGVSSIAC